MGRKKKKNEIPEIESVISFYCEVCNGCGEEGCCSPVSCSMDPKGRYCETYLKDLKFGYMMFRETYNMLNENKEQNEELLKKIDELWDKIDKKIYNK